MKFLAGTSAGVFACDGDNARLALEARGVRELVASNGRLLAGTSMGLMASEDGARTWTPSGLDGHAVWQIRGAANGMTYAATAPAKLFASSDSGRQWQEVDAFAAHPEARDWCVPVKPVQPGRARALVIDADDPRRMWVGVEVGGIMRSGDGGATWELGLPGDNPDIHMMFAHPARPQTLFVSTGYGRPGGVAEMVEGNAGVFRSDDGGSTWAYAWRGVTPRYSRPMCIDPRSPYALTVASAPNAFSSVNEEGGAQAVLLRSDDDGESWRSLGDTAHAPSAANFHGLVVDPTTPGGVLVGTDSGEVWQVSANCRWRQLASGLPAVLSILPL